MKHDYIQEIQKFNPYHGKDGRFASSTGYASFTIRTKDPKKQHMADMAIAREKERHAAQMANPTNDPDTIAGVKRGKPMTHEQADQGNANPNHGKDRGYSVNCQSCVVAYEARLRGYDVEAKPKTGNNTIQNSLSKDQKIAWKDPKTGETAKEINNPPNINRQTQVKKWLNDNMEEGARYAFSHGWKGTDGMRGHVICATKEGGNIKLFDPQNGKNYSGDGVNEYISRVKATWSYRTYYYNSGTQGRLGLIRIDNKQIDAIVANAVLKGAGQ